MPQNTNQEYLDGLKNGNTKIIVSIYTILYPKVRKFVLKNEGTEQESKEVFQDALFQLTARLKVSELHLKSSFQGYFFTICKNLWRKELNSKKRWVRNDDNREPPNEERDHSTDIIIEERKELFQEKLLELSENCRELLLAHFRKVPYSEIIERFNYASENVAFQRMFKCKKRLNDLVKKDRRYSKLKS